MTGKRYTLLEQIGAGGMAVVYRAELLREPGFRKTVAVKRLLPHMVSDPARVQMLVDEARILSQLGHPNIVQVLDFENVGDEYLLVLEFVHGRSLEQVLERCAQRGLRIPAGLAAHVAAEVAAGLAFAHHKTDDQGRPLGIVHRDVSPQNILLSFDGQVKVTDFGIARASLRRTRTEAGTTRGKAGYMAPEQARGAALDARADLFALGTVLFEMLSGERLFGDSSEGALLLAVSEWQGFGEQRLPPGVPDDLQTILGRLLQAEPGRRYQDAELVLADLRECAVACDVTSGAQDLADWIEGMFGEEAVPPTEESRPDLRAGEDAITEAEGLTSLIHPDQGRTAVTSILDLTTRLDEPATEIQSAGRRAYRLSFLAGLVLAVLAIAALAWGLWSAMRSGSATDRGSPTGSDGAWSTGRHEVDAGPAGEPDAGLAVRSDAAPSRPTGDTAATPDPDQAPASRRPGLRFGRLSLNTDPWAHVEIDGKKLGRQTPIVNLRLRAGKHRIRLSNPVVGRSKTITVFIPAGKKIRRSVRF